jgi:hypothetical protein
VRLSFVKIGETGTYGATGEAARLPAVHLAVFVSQMNALRAGYVFVDHGLEFRYAWCSASLPLFDNWMYVLDSAQLFRYCIAKAQTRSGRCLNADAWGKIGQGVSHWLRLIAGGLKVGHVSSRRLEANASRAAGHLVYSRPLFHF